MSPGREGLGEGRRDWVPRSRAGKWELLFRVQEGTLKGTKEVWPSKGWKGGSHLSRGRLDLEEVSAFKGQWSWEIKKKDVLSCQVGESPQSLGR